MKRNMWVRDTKGFTLVELLIVMAILGILAGIAVPVYLGHRQKAAQTEAKQNLLQLRTLQEQYLADNGEYAPANGSETNPMNFALLRTYFPGWKPGDANALMFIYTMDYVVDGTTTIGFTATGVGKGGTYVDGNTMTINHMNEKSW